MKAPLISVVLPVHNQADHVGEVVRAYAGALDKIPNPREIILVPNACTDSSVEVCLALAREYPFVRVKEAERGGWGSAVLTGLRAASGEILCYTNLARTSAEDLTLLVLYAVAHPDTVVKANRKIRESSLRRLGSLLYNLECRSLFDLPYWDINGTPKVFPRAFGKLTTLAREDDLIDAEFTAVCRREGYRVLEVPIFSHRRHGGTSTTNWRSALKMYWGAYKMWREWRKGGA